MINSEFRFNPISIFNLQTSISNICFEQARMPLSFLFIVQQTNIRYGFAMIITHTEVLRELYIISIHTFIQSLINLQHFSLLL